MIWLTWRRRRRETLILGVVLAAIALYLYLYGLSLHTAYYHVANGLSPALCDQQPNRYAACPVILINFRSAFEDDIFSFAGLYLAPALVGMFLGAPLVASELERGTHQLVWTQGVTRTRWLLTSVGGQALIALLPFAVLIPLIPWWNGPSDVVTGSAFSAFDAVGIAPLAYTLFALALAVVAGAILRSTVGAMFVTFVAYLAVRLPITFALRRHYLPPLTMTWDPFLTRPPHTLPTTQDLRLFSGEVTASGQQVSTATVYQTCGGSSTAGQTLPPGNPFNACLHANGWLAQVIWQPANRFWLFQGIESAIFLALALLLIGLTVWWVGRRLG